MTALGARDGARIIGATDGTEIGNVGDRIKVDAIINVPVADIRFNRFFENGGSNDLQVDGSTTPVSFKIVADATYDLNVTLIRIFGGGNGIQFGNFLSKSSVLTTGIEIKGRSQNAAIEFVPAPIKSTEDLKNFFASPISGSNFRLDIVSGTDQVSAEMVFAPSVPLVIRKAGTFGTDDELEIIINDNLTAGLSQLGALASGTGSLP